MLRNQRYNNRIEEFAASEIAGNLMEIRMCFRKVTVVADVVGGAIWRQLISALARGGRYTCAGAIAGATVSFDLRTF